MGNNHRPYLRVKRLSDNTRLYEIIGTGQSSKVVRDGILIPDGAPHAERVATLKEFLGRHFRQYRDLPPTPADKRGTEEDYGR